MRILLLLFVPLISGLPRTERQVGLFPQGIGGQGHIGQYLQSQDQQLRARQRPVFNQQIAAQSQTPINNKQADRPKLRDIPPPKEPSKQLLDFGEASYVAGLNSNYDKRPEAPKKKKPMKLTPKAVKALQGLPDEALISIVRDQTGGKLNLTPEQVKTFKSTDPETLAELINSGALNEDNAGTFGSQQQSHPSNVQGANPANGQPYQPQSQGRPYPQTGYPPNYARPNNQFFGSGVPSRSLIPNPAISSAYGSRMHYGNGLQYPAGGIGAQRIAPVRAGRPTVTVQQIRLLRGLPDATVKTIAKNKAGVDLTDDQVRMMKSLPPEQVAQMINSGQLSNTLPNDVLIPGKGPAPVVTPGQLSLLRGLPDDQVKKIVKQRTGETLTDEEVKTIKTLPPDTLADMINSGKFPDRSKPIQKEDPKAGSGAISDKKPGNKKRGNNKSPHKPSRRDKSGGKSSSGQKLLSNDGPVRAKEVEMWRKLPSRKMRKRLRERTGIKTSKTKIKAIRTLAPRKVAALINHKKFTDKRLKKILKKH